MPRIDTWTPPPVSAPPSFLSNSSALSWFVSTCFPNQARLLQAALWVCRWMYLQVSPSAAQLEATACLGWSFTAVVTQKNPLKKPGRWAEKRHPKKHPLGVPFLQERPSLLLIEHLWILERELERERKSSCSPGPRGKFQSELAMNHKTKPLETKLHYFYCTQNYLSKASLTWSSQQFN